MRCLRLVVLAFLLACGCCAALAGEPASEHLYQIKGVAISTRDSSPIPYCRMQATAASSEALTGGGESRRGRGGYDGGGRRETPGTDAVTADAHGRFQIDLPGAGAWRVTGSARGFRRQDYDAHDEFFSAIVITAAAPSLEVVFRMSPDSELTGLITDDAGEPVEHAQVVAELMSSSAHTGARRAGFAQTDDRGRYDIGGLAPGPYRLSVQATPWFAQGAGRRLGVALRGQNLAPPPPEPSLDLVFATAWFPGTDDELAAETIQLAGGEERQADFHLVPIAAAHIRVAVPEAPAAPGTEDRARPQRGITVTRVGGENTGFNQTMSTTESQLDFGGLSPGIYEIRTQAPDGRGASDVRQIQILPGSSGVVDLSTAKELSKVTVKIDSESGAQTDNVSFTDNRTGVTTTTAGEMMHRLFDNFGGRRSPDTGRFIYLLPGSYKVSVGTYGTSFLTGISATDATVKGLTVTIGERPATVILHWGTGKAEVSGFAKLDGQPAAGAMLLLVPATLGEPDNVAEIVREQTNTDGSFRMRNVMPGRYILLAIVDGWGLNWKDVETLAPYLTHGVPLALEPGGKAKKELVAQRR